MEDFDRIGIWEQFQKRLTWQQLGEFQGKVILDFGCGNGIMAAHYAKDNTVIAIEPDEEVLKAFPHPEITVIHGDYQAMHSIPTESVDLILCHNVLEYANQRKAILGEFARLLKSDGKISVLKHNVPGRVMQMAVLLNDFIRANGLLDGSNTESAAYGMIHHYGDQDLTRWEPKLIIESIRGMRVFWDLQQNQSIQMDPAWQKEMLQLEQRVSNLEPYRSVAFFHHIILRKQKKT